jgi:hypothetical protein
MKWAKELIRASKTGYAWDALFISQAIFVMTSSDVDDGRYILTTSGVRKISIDLAYQASPLLRFRGVSSMPSWRTPPSANETFEEFDNAVQSVHAAFGMARSGKFVAFLRIAHVFHRFVEDLQTPIEHLRLDHAGPQVPVRMDDEQRRLDICHMRQRRVGIQMLAYLFLPGIPSVMGGHQAIAAFMPTPSQ